MALISLEDLEGLDEDHLEDEVAEPPEAMEEGGERERLYTHWQAVASTHHVSVPPELTGPIQEMTRQSREREQVPYVTISQHEKLGEVVYEERVYPAGSWACVTRGEKLYEQSISMGFMKLMRFICKDNSLGRYLGMTVPIVNNIQMLKDGKSFKKDILTAYYIPAEFQASPPQPTDSDITIVSRSSFRVISRVFFGTTTEETILEQMGGLWELLGSAGRVQTESYMVAVYQNPGVPGRRNEIWFICLDP